MKKISGILFMLFSVTTIAQNVGIGEANPTESKLQIKTTDSAALLIQNTASALNTKTGLFYKSDNNYAGSIATIQTAPSFYRMGLFTFGGAAASGLKERVSILDGGNVGIGTTNPTAKLEVAGTLKIADGTQGTGKVLSSDAAGNASWTSIGSQFGYKKTIQYAPVFGGTFSGNFIVPAGVTEIMVELWGAGSGGTTVSNIEKSFGGTSGGYARTVQTVTPGQSCSYTIGQGSSPQTSGFAVTDGGNTVFNFNANSLTAYGGRGRSANPFTPGDPRSGTGTVDNFYVLYGNTGNLPTVSFVEKSPGVFLEIRKNGDGGRTPGIVDAPTPKGGFTYFENGVFQYNVNDNSSVHLFPSCGGFSIYSGASSAAGNGMILILYN